MKFHSMHHSTFDAVSEIDIAGRKVAFVKADFDMEQ